MKLRRRSWFLAAAIVVAGCQAIAGIGDHELTVAPTDTPDSGEETGAPGCDHANPPPAPAKDSDPGSGVYVIALRSVDVTGRRDGGPIVGYDLDQACTGDPRETRGPSCKSMTVRPDDEGGVDNESAHLFDETRGVPGAEGLLVGPLRDLACGAENTLIVITDYNGLADDTNVSVAILESYGIAEPHPTEAPPDAAACGTAQPPYAAQWNITDRWSVTPGAFNRNDNRPRTTTRGYVTNFHLVVDARVGVANQFPILVGPRIVQVGTPVLTGRLVPMGQDGSDLPTDRHGVTGGVKPAAFRMDDGIISGRVHIDELVSAFGAGRIKNTDDSNPYLCANAILYLGFKQRLCSEVDIMADQGDDFHDRACNGLSMSVQFTTSPASIGSQDVPAPPSRGDGGCSADFRDTCGL